MILTTAGLTFAATSMVADDSSMVTGWTVPTLLPCPVGDTMAVVRSRLPVAASAATVPVEARTADRSATARIEPVPERELRPRSTAGSVATAATGAGSYQRSGVGGTVFSAERAQSGRASGVGENWSAGTSAAGVPGVIGAIGVSSGRSVRWVGSSVMGSMGPRGSGPVSGRRRKCRPG